MSKQCARDADYFSTVGQQLHAMRRDGIKRSIVTLCIGGGQGIALALGK